MAKNEKEVKCTSQFSIVNKIAAMLKIGDSGKLDNFIMRVEKTLKRESAAFEKNMDTIKFNSTNELDELKDQLEDAQQELSDSFMEINPESVNTNEKANNYVDTFLENINRKRQAVKRIEETIKSRKEKSNDRLDEIKSDIKFNEDLIKSITAKEKK